MLPLLHNLRRRRSEDEKVQHTRAKHDSNGGESGPQMSIQQQSPPTTLPSPELLPSRVDNLYAGPGDGQYDGQRSLKSKVRRSDFRLKSCELRPREAGVTYWACEEGLEDVGSEKSAVGDDVVCIGIGYRCKGRHFVPLSP